MEEAAVGSGLNVKRELRWGRWGEGRQMGEEAVSKAGLASFLAGSPATGI